MFVSKLSLYLLDKFVNCILKLNRPNNGSLVTDITKGTLVTVVRWFGDQGRSFAIGEYGDVWPDISMTYSRHSVGKSPLWRWERGARFPAKPPPVPSEPFSQMIRRKKWRRPDAI